jgi:outer membrane murein-binding lipoprotein Lpp
MRRHLVLAAAIAGVLILSGCGSDSGAKRTVTAVVTVSSGADASGSAESSGAPASGAPASGDSAASSAAGSPSPSGSGLPSPTAVSPAPFVTVDPTKVDCAAVISAADVKKIFNVDIPNDRRNVPIKAPNTDVGQTGQVRCLYGLSADKTTGAFSVLLTQYSDATAAQKQVDLTVKTQSDNGAQIIPTTVSGYPATIALQDGGLIVMTYDTWTMAIASFSTTPIDPTVLQAGLPQLAEAALARVVKG